MTLDAPTTRRLAALAVAAVGVMNIISALYPAVRGRLELLNEVVPFHVIRGTQTATVLVGFFLILLADGLRKRSQRAWQLAVILLLISSVLNLAKGLDYEESLIAGSLCTFLIAVRAAFDLPARLPAPRRLWRPVGLFLLLCYTYLLSGFLILRHAVAPVPRFWTATLEPLRLVTGDSGFLYLTAQARWFERSITVMLCVAILVAAVQAIRPLIPRPKASADDLARARALVQRYGDDTLAYFALQDGRSYFFDASGEAFLSYRLWGDVALVGGDPIGLSSRIPSLMASFLEFADAHGMTPCLLGVDGRFLPLYRSLGMSALKIGEEALIDLDTFDPISLKRKVRRAVRHIDELGIRAVTYSRCQVPGSIVEQIDQISRSWVEQKGGVERGFSMTLGRFPRRDDDADCEITVALDGEKVLGYICMVPVPCANAWSLDAMRRRPDGPNGLMEFVLVRAAQHYRSRGFCRLSLNFASLSNAENDIDSRALEGLRRFIFEYLSSVYQLKSLYQFNVKFQPTWRSRYLVFRRVLEVPKLTLAIVQSEDPVRLPKVVHAFRR